MPSKLSTSTSPIVTTSTTYANPLSTSTYNYNNASIPKMTQSVNTNVNNSQMLGINSINPSMSIYPTNNSMAASTKYIQIPLSSSHSNSNLLQSSIDLNSSLGKSVLLNYSYMPRIYSRSLSKKKLNNYDNYYY